MPYSVEELINELQRVSDRQIAPSIQEFRKEGNIGKNTYKHQFGTWWRAVVLAGLTPQCRRPLSNVAFKQFFRAAINSSDPKRRLIGLIQQFTGLPSTYLEEFTPEWVTNSKYDTTITVPETVTKSGEEWTFKLPESWGKDNTKTELPGFLNWYLETYGSFNIHNTTSWKAVADITQEADLQREVAPQDLRASGGCRMARNGAPTRRIRRHLGIEHTNWQATVQDFFIWNYIHSNGEFSHPDWNPDEALPDGYSLELIDDPVAQSR